MKNFFENIKNSVYSPQFYKEVSASSFKKAFIYFFLLALFLTLIRTISLFNLLVIKTPLEFTKSVEKTVNCYPEDLKINIEGGVASTSAKEPYYLSCEKEKEASLSAIAVIDTKTPYSIEQFNKYQAPFWLTKNTFVIKTNSTETKTYDLSKMKNFSLDKNIVDSSYKSYSKYFVFIGPVLLFLSFVFIYTSYTLNLIYLLIFSLILLLFAKFFNQKISYKDAYKLSLYIITAPLIIELIIDLMKPWFYFGGFPFMLTIIALGFSYLNLIYNQDNK